MSQKENYTQLRKTPNESLVDSRICNSVYKSSKSVSAYAIRAYVGSVGIAQLILNLSTRWR